MKREINFFGKTTGDGHPTFIIAELGINHQGDIDTALKLIDAAAESGADAVKFQTYQTEKRTPKDSPIFDILKKCELPFSDFKKLKEHASRKKIPFFSTPFDTDSVDYLESIGCELYKIASFCILQKDLLEKVAKTKKNVILSVGMSNIQEIEQAALTLGQHGSQVALLHCVSSYPTPESETHLGAIPTLREKFPYVIGQSDHTSDIQVPLYAVAAGARILEKHFRLENDLSCVDAPVSISPSQMRRLSEECRRLEKILGSSEVALRSVEKEYLWLRRK